MFTGEIKKNLFKVKKVKINGEEIQGVVAPLFNSYRCEFKCNEFKFITGNRCYELHSSYYPIKTTKVGNEKLKKIYEDIIVEEKKGYKLYLEMIKLEEKKKKLCEDVDKIDCKTNVLRDKALKVQGFITDKEFNDIFKDIINKTYNGYSLEATISSRKIVELKLSKQVELERWVKEESYDFLTENYDGTMFVEYDYLPESKSMKTLKEKYFRDINTKKIDNNMIIEEFDAYVSDKRTLYIRHDVKVVFKKEIELRKENLKKIKNIIDKLVNII